MLADLSLLLSVILDTLTSIWSLYVGGGILTAVLAIWVVRRIATILHIIKR